MDIEKIKFQIPKRQRITLLFSFLFLIFGLVLPACKKQPGSTSQPPAAGKTLYHCAMHPQIVSDRPGECPICHMKLSPFTPSADQPSKKILYYRNPMDPKATSPVPMKDSMGMDYIPVYENEEAGGTSVPGQATIRLNSAIEQRIGVQVAEAKVGDLILPIRAAARVAYDPQLYSAALEHREARKFLSQAGEGESHEQAEATVRASELRLRQMGLSDAQIDEISQPGYDLSSLLVGSRGGSLWVYADVFDNQVSSVRPGEIVELTSPALPGKVFKGTVKGIDPVVNSETRTVKVRIRVENPQGQLKPGTYLSAVIQASLGKALTVPDSAVIDTGARQLVYVQTGAGTYEPRQVRVGRQAEGAAEIVEGLKPGEKVATSANFLIDSESRIQGAAEEAQ